MINKKNQENQKSLFAIRSDSEILADPSVTSLCNFIVPDLDLNNMAHAIPNLDDLLRVEQVQSDNLTSTQNSVTSNAMEHPTNDSSSGSSLNLPGKIDTTPAAKEQKTNLSTQQPEDLIAGPSTSTQKSDPSHLVNSDSAQNTTQISADIHKTIKIEKDTDQTGIVIKRIWAKKLVDTDSSFFTGGTKSLLDLKDPYKWLNRYVMRVSDKKKTFRSLLHEELLFCNPGQSDPMLGKYYNYINARRITNQSIVIGYKTFVRDLLRMICKPETFCMLSRNFGELPFDRNLRKQTGIFLDELVKACEPNLDGKSNPISGHRIEELVREYWYRILDNDKGAEKIEVNFKKTNISYNYLLKQLLKFNQFSWGNVTGISLNPSGDFDANEKAEAAEAQLLLRNLICTDLVAPGELSSLFAANMATDWKINENGIIVAIEKWDPTKLTRLSKPASPDNILKNLKSEIK